MAIVLQKMDSCVREQRPHRIFHSHTPIALALQFPWHTQGQALTLCKLLIESFNQRSSTQRHRLA